ncbi:MFS transporter [Spirillospora sp. NPDC048911]|uniref:MFS transporter n=1 Tax=Spirillospora sp. NPDC048911 TaxID=3364527 RepID=UPI00371F5883
MATRRLLDRELAHFPEQPARIRYLALVVLSTIVLYYVQYEPGGVSPLLLRHYDMSFTYYVNVIVVANILGAVASYVGGLSDRIGRANLVIWGLLVVGVLTTFVIPAMPNKATFAIVFIVIGFVEGVILVATPALVRDFSPQLGRAKAMGFWTIGPVAGSLVVAIVTRRTLEHLSSWQGQVRVSGIACLVMFVVALLWLRELSPALRAQLMVSERDRVVLEARAEGIDVAAAQRDPWRQMIRWDLIGSATAVSVFLLFYYSVVAFSTIVLTTIFGLSTDEANGINQWYWGVNLAALVLTGFASDRVLVRKPFMLAAAVALLPLLIYFLVLTDRPDTSYTTLAVVMSLIAACMGVAYTAWMAAFTEAVERHNPALMATGLAVWATILRTTVAVSLFLVPFIVDTVTKLVEAPAVLALVPKDGSPPPPAILRELAEIKKAAAESPDQWQTWWWICIAGVVVFIAFIFTMSGHWRPAAARAAAAEHEARIEAERERLESATS